MLTEEQRVFVALVRVGLWENEKGKSAKEQECKINDSLDWNQFFQLAEEQSMVGLVTAGINKIREFKGSPVVPKRVTLFFVGRAMQLEHQNMKLNHFVGNLVDKMQEKGIETLLVKGQGVAQCYERPLWRASGDVDLLLDKDNYKKAKDFLLPLSSGSKPEEQYSQHLGIEITPWYVELHGSLRTGLSERIDIVIDDVLNDVFRNGRVRTWMNDNTRVTLPAPNHDVFLVFTHFIKHFYKEGMTLRQICDWVRLLWTYRDEIDVTLLESWVTRAGLMKEWQVFASLAVDYLGMPEDAMPLFKSGSFRSARAELGARGQGINDCRLHKKAEQLFEFILRGYSGNKLKDSYQVAKIFPWQTFRYSPSIFLNVNGLKIKERIKGSRT